MTTSADVEDVHLGYRLRDAGYRIVLDPSLRVHHHKRYTVRGVISSDVFHRAVPWTRTMLQLRTFSNDLNLRRSSMMAAAIALAMPASAAAAIWTGPFTLALTAVLAGVWLGLHASFLRYVAKTWSVRGAVASAGLLYLYYLYSVAGTIMGTAAFVLRHEPQSSLNRLRIEGESPRPGVAVTVAVIAAHGEPAPALGELPAPAPWWELIVVAEAPPPGLRDDARFIATPATATRNEMRHVALADSQGEVFVTLDAQCLPSAGWLECVRAISESAVLVAAGPFQHDRRSIRSRAEQVVRYWNWRPERRAGWNVHHPATNACFRTDVARALGGFLVEGALIVRMGTFGARPVRFVPGMSVAVGGTSSVPRFIRGVAGVARLRASTTVRYFDISLLHRVVLVTVSPVMTTINMLRLVRDAVRERSADRTFWLALPLIVLGVYSQMVGRNLGLLWPGRRGGLVPRRAEDIEAIGGSLEPAAP